MGIILFQSTLPRRERQEVDLPGQMDIEISIHAPAKGATEKAGYIAKGRLFQSTLPRRERQECPDYVKEDENISIHAPAKGATFNADIQITGNDISIHAPAKGATLRKMIEALS